MNINVPSSGLILGAERRVTTIDCDVHPWIRPEDVAEFIPSRGEPVITPTVSVMPTRSCCSTIQRPL